MNATRRMMVGLTREGWRWLAWRYLRNGQFADGFRCLWRSVRARKA
jgi:hypothetical protein